MISMEQFAVNNMGQSLGNPGTGTYRGQCVSYVRQYMEQVDGVKTSIWGHAVSYYDSESVGAFYDKVPAGQEQNGDILCWGNDAGSWTGPEGHMAIRYAPGKILNSNFGGSLVASVNNFFSQGYQGALRLKEKKMIIQNAPNWFGRCNRTMNQIRGRDLGQEEFTKYAVGAEFLNWVEAVSDNAEADTATGWQNLGRLAAKDNWQQQIYDGQARELVLTKERNTTRDNLLATETALNAAQIQATATPTEVIVVKNIPMSFDELSLGEILNAAFAKLFKIK